MKRRILMNSDSNSSFLFYGNMECSDCVAASQPFVWLRLLNHRAFLAALYGVGLYQKSDFLI
ncbi:hypothetical protein GF337_03310 [candidate division KSB1 bacterium]|nr:hypothetical protein [candidate division KSB1 bacterium]